MTDTAPLIAALQNPALYDHPVEGFQLVETHISWVILTGPYAYKVKKPMDFGFLDFTTLEKRKFFCEEELRLNRRLAPQLYLEVVAIGGSPEAPVLGGGGEPFEYAVRMAQFDQDALADRALARGELGATEMDQAAQIVADFHAVAAVAGPERPFGSSAMAHAPVRENFEQIRPLLSETADLERLEAMRQWAEQRHGELDATLDARKAAGAVRECHGDIHLANIAILDGQVTLFDGIEFNEPFRWTDVMADVAFLVMDLDDRKRPDLGRRFINGYLERSGDYGGLAVLPYYQSYRAMVRAKVACLRRGQPGLSADEQAAIHEQFRGYLGLAEGYAERTAPWIALTHGPSGGGKSHLSQALVERTGAIRLRSDVERKRLFGLAAEDSSDSAVNGGLYTAEATRKTYARLEELATTITAARYPVVIDATFLKGAERTRFRALAERLGLPFHLLDIQCDEALLRERVAGREGDASEADVAVLEMQLKSREPLSEEERAAALPVDGAAPDLDALAARLSNA
ncbi:bifunctional aminoglycoside phosphotransferase/ATP-binding protein [Endothiovibrio diazotrophicus]